MGKEKRGCRAKIVLGPHLHETWARCKIRFNGKCCKDCEKLPYCACPCAFLHPYFELGSGKPIIDNFTCKFYLTKLEAVLKRLDTDENRGIPYD